MKQEADQMGFFQPQHFDRKVPIFQIRTVKELLEDQAFDLPKTGGLGTHGIKRAVRVKASGQQDELEMS